MPFIRIKNQYDAEIHVNVDHIYTVEPYQSTLDKCEIRLSADYSHARTIVVLETIDEVVKKIEEAQASHEARTLIKHDMSWRLTDRSLRELNGLPGSPLNISVPAQTYEVNPDGSHKLGCECVTCRVGTIFMGGSSG